jgi:hypothetical protein
VADHRKKLISPLFESRGICFDQLKTPLKYFRSQRESNFSARHLFDVWVLLQRWRPAMVTAIIHFLLPARL